jgi:hypothetical protein
MLFWPPCINSMDRVSVRHQRRKPARITHLNAQNQVAKLSRGRPLSSVYFAAVTHPEVQTWLARGKTADRLGTEAGSGDFAGRCARHLSSSRFDDFGE